MWMAIYTLPLPTVELQNIIVENIQNDCDKSAAEEERSSDSTLDFYCGEPGKMRFPFYSNSVNSTCSPFKLNCSGLSQTIQLVEGGRWYDVEMDTKKGRWRRPASTACSSTFFIAVVLFVISILPRYPKKGKRWKRKRKKATCGRYSVAGVVGKFLANIF